MKKFIYVLMMLVVLTTGCKNSTYDNGVEGVKIEQVGDSMRVTFHPKVVQTIVDDNGAGAPRRSGSTSSTTTPVSTLTVVDYLNGKKSTTTNYKADTVSSLTYTVARGDHDFAFFVADNDKKYVNRGDTAIRFPDFGYRLPITSYHVDMSYDDDYSEISVGYRTARLSVTILDAKSADVDSIAVAFSNFSTIYSPMTDEAICFGEVTRKWKFNNTSNTFTTTSSTLVNNSDTLYTDVTVSFYKGKNEVELYTRTIPMVPVLKNKKTLLEYKAFTNTDQMQISIDNSDETSWKYSL